MWRSSISDGLVWNSYGIEVLGDSDNLWLANLLADSQVKNRMRPRRLGFFGASLVTVGISL